jgi:hypothetical protein
MNLFQVARKLWDRLMALALTIAGAVLLISGWVGVSGTDKLFEQTPYIMSGGLGGMFLLGIGGVLWLSADLRDEWHKLDHIERSLGRATLTRDGDEGQVATNVEHGPRHNAGGVRRDVAMAASKASGDG